MLTQVEATLPTQLLVLSFLLLLCIIFIIIIVIIVIILLLLLLDIVVYHDSLSGKAWLYEKFVKLDSNNYK